MSYCRIGDDSDVYVFRTNNGDANGGPIWTTVVRGGETYLDNTRLDLLLRLDRFAVGGVRVPDRTRERLMRELAEEDAADETADLALAYLEADVREGSS